MKIKNGFTLIELLIAMAITGFVSAGIFAAFQSQQKSYITQENVSVMQQNLRAGMHIMASDIRMAGYDVMAIYAKVPAPVLGAASACDYNYNDYGITAAGSNSMSFTADFNNDGCPVTAGESLQYQLYDSDLDGTNDALRRIINGPAVVEGIDALGFAYAFDADGNGTIDTYNVGGNEAIIWAVDSDGDNDLDINLDTDGDGDIDADDGPGVGGNALIAGQALVDFIGNAIADVGVADIRAVKIWLLARSDRADNDFFNNRTYTVGNQIITPNDSFRRRVMVSTVKCRNLELKNE